MADRYIDLGGVDRVDLEFFARDFFREVFSAGVKDCADEIVATLNNADVELKDEVVHEIREDLSCLLDPDLAVSKLINELGNMGWEVLGPSSVRDLKKIVKFYNSFMESRLSKLVLGCRTGRVPRVKRLRR